MLEHLKQLWLRLKKDEPGQRFQNYYRRRHRQNHGPAKQILLIAAGALLMLVGLLMLVAPGPGILVCALAAAILAGVSRHAANLLDVGELSGRKLLDKIRARR